MNEENLKLQRNIKDEVLNKIKSGQINMRSKFYFLLKLGLLFTLVVFIFFVSVFLLSFIIFSLNVEGSLFLVRFGGKGLYNFLFVIPWYLLFIDILLLILLDVLLKSFRFGYKRPIVYLFGGTFFVVTLLSTLLDFTPFHYNAMRNENIKKVPFSNELYGGVSSIVQKPGSWKGMVDKVDRNTFLFTYLVNQNGDTATATVTSTRSDIDLRNYLKVGDLVFVAGNINNNHITAYGIKKLNE